jgi:glycosyltransferase involved in cell wall biosynthesis
VKTVLFVVSSLFGGGAERVIVQLVNHVDRRRFVPMLALGSATGPYLRDVRDDVTVRELGAWRARAAGPALVKLVRSVRPDVVLSTTGLNLAVSATRSFFPRHTRVILREGNTPSAFLDDVARDHPGRARIYRAAYRHLYQRADTVICQSEAMLTDLSALGVPAEKLSCIYNPVDTGRIRDLAAAEPPSPSPGPGPRLVTVGKLHRQKGYDILLRAVASVREEHPQVSLAIIGDGDERAALERTAEELGLGSSVVFTGFLQNPYPSIADADLFVSSSRYEGFSNAIVEAFACGTPVVATDCPSANREVIAEGVNGWLARSEDDRSLAVTICRGLAERPRLDSRAIQDQCEERFSADRIVERYEALF